MRGEKPRKQLSTSLSLKEVDTKQMHPGEVSLCHLWDRSHDDKEERQEAEQQPHWSAGWMLAFDKELSSGTTASSVFLCVSHKQLF